MLYLVWKVQAVASVHKHVPHCTFHAPETDYLLSVAMHVLFLLTSPQGTVFCVALSGIPTSLYWNALSLFPYQCLCVLPCFFLGPRFRVVVISYIPQIK